MSTKRQALGRGLAALIPGAAPPDTAAAVDAERRPAEAPREGLRTVAIEDVHPMRGQPRKSFDDVPSTSWRRPSAPRASSSP